MATIKTNRIVLFKNNNIKDESKDNPTLRGNIVLSNELDKKYISLWSRFDKNNKGYWAGNVDNVSIVMFKNENKQFKNLAYGTITMPEGTYQFKLFGRKSQNGTAFWEGELTKVNIREENDVDSIDFDEGQAMLDKKDNIDL